MTTQIKTINCNLFRVPLAEVMNDAKHGDHTQFELVTTTITLGDGTHGTGYTYTGGKGGHAIKAMVDNDIAPALLGKDGSEIDAIYDFLVLRTKLESDEESASADSGQRSDSNSLTTYVLYNAQRTLTGARLARKYTKVRTVRLYIVYYTNTY